MKKKAISQDIITLAISAVALLLVFFTPGDASSVAKKDSKTDQLIRNIRDEDKQLREQRPVLVELKEKVENVSKLNSEITRPEAIERFRNNAISRIINERRHEFERNWTTLKSYQD